MLAAASMPTLAAPAAAARPTRRAALWLAFLGPWFFLTYGLCNSMAARMDFVPSYYAGWERALPFLPWLLLPYWTIDAFYAASLFTARSRAALDVLGKRLALATLISCIGFLMFPLRFAFERPEVDGFNGWLLARLMDFDKPFNQAPSLHISLLVVLWVHYLGVLRGKWKWLLSAWFAVIGVSVVGTWQHHMIDVYGGLIAGVLCLYLVPDAGLADTRHSLDPARRKLAIAYALGALVMGALWAALVHAGAPWIGLLFAWTALSLAIVALGYARIGAQVLQKREGVIGWPARLVLAPYLLGAWLSARLHNRGSLALREVGAGLYLGRLPGKIDAAALQAAGITAVLDMTVEFSRPVATAGMAYLNVPVLDLTAPSVAQLQRAAGFINAQRGQGRVLVHCALGLSRSACAVVAAEVARGVPLEAALAQLRAAQPRVVLREAHLRALGRLTEGRHA